MCCNNLGKRGHEKVVEVLVTMGAEIHIRDARSRTARDTAARRAHTNLLYWLDSQIQVKHMQEFRRSQRNYQLLEMRKAFQLNRLQLHPTELQLINVLESLHVSTNEMKTVMKSKSLNPSPVLDRASSSASTIETLTDIHFDLRECTLNLFFHVFVCLNVYYFDFSCKIGKTRNCSD